MAEGSFGRALWLHGSARIAASWRWAAQRRAAQGRAEQRSAVLAHHACDGIWVHAGRSGQDLQRLVLHRLNAVALHILTPGKTQMIVVSWVGGGMPAPEPPALAAHSKPPQPSNTHAPAQQPHSGGQPTPPHPSPPSCTHHGPGAVHHDAHIHASLLELKPRPPLLHLARQLSGGLGRGSARLQGGGSAARGARRRERRHPAGGESVNRCGGNCGFLTGSKIQSRGWI